MREMQLYRSKLSFLFILTWLFGCGEPTHPDSREMYYFTVVESRQPEPVVVEDERPKLTDEQVKAYRPIVDAFKKSGLERLKEPQVKNHLERIEQVFISMGDYLDLVALYEKDYEEHGLAAQSADRLAFAYVRLGHKKKARDRIDELMKKRPDAMSHFLDGSFWVRQTPRTAETMKATYLAWSRVLESDSRFRGFEGINAQVLREELAAYRKRLPDDLLAEIDEILKKEKDAKASEAITNAEDENSNALETQTGETALPDADQNAPETEKEVALAPEVPVATPEPKEVPTEVPTENNAQLYPIEIARGELALSEGRIKDAETFFIKAKALKPDGIDAEFGQIRAAWHVESARNGLVPRVKALEEKSLTPQQAYDIGLFVASKMTNLELAKKFWAKAASDDAFSKRVNLKKLLEQ